MNTFTEPFAVAGYVCQRNGFQGVLASSTLVIAWEKETTLVLTLLSLCCRRRLFFSEENRAWLCSGCCYRTALQPGVFPDLEWKSIVREEIFQGWLSSFYSTLELVIEKELLEKYFDALSANFHWSEYEDKIPDWLRQHQWCAGCYALT